MKRIGAVLLSVCLLLACAVPAGAYQWSGQSFIDDYYGVSPLSFYEVEGGAFSTSSVGPVSLSVSGSYDRTFSVDSFVSLPDGYFSNSIFSFRSSQYSSLFSVDDAPYGSYYIDFSAPTVDLVFTFDEPVSSFSFDGSLTCRWTSRFTVVRNGVKYASDRLFYPSIDVLVNDSVVSSFAGSSPIDMSSVSYTSFSPISSFVLRYRAFSGSLTITDYGLIGFSVFMLLLSPSSDPFTITTVPYGGEGSNPSDPVVPGEGDFEYTVKIGEELVQDVKLSSGVTTGGGNVYWSYDSYETGSPLYPVTVPGGAAHQMVPARFPSISLSKSGTTVTASIPSTSYTFSWAGGCRVERFETLLTGPPGFSGPGSAALDYIDFEIPFSSDEDVHNFELDGAVSVETAYRAGSNSASRVGGSWSLLVNGALVNSGTTDTYGNIQFNNFVYYSSEPISSLTLRLVPTAAGLAFPSNTGSITFSWAVALGLDGLSMVYLEGEDEAIDFDRFYSQINDAQNSIDSYDKIENQWTANMTSNWNALKMDSFSFDAGLISGFALLTGIFNDIWTAFGVFNVVWIVPLMLGIALLVIGRISRSSGAGKEE